MSDAASSDRIAPPETILIGLGATKAGTSWLSRYLREHPECAGHGPKELHFFNGRTSSDGLETLVRKNRRKIRLFSTRLKRKPPGSPARPRIQREIRAFRHWIKALKRGEDQDWLDYLGWAAQDAKVACDITPAYGVMDVEALRRIASLHPRVRFVYLMRDPVARMWSHARMRAMRAASGRAIDAPIHEADAREVMRGAIRGEVAAINDRGDYAAALARLGELDPSTYHVAFYEELFTDEGVAPICRLLGIEFRSGDYDRRVHGGLKVSLDPETRAMARAFLEPQYDAVQAWAGRLPEAWRHTEAA